MKGYFVALDAVGDLCVWCEGDDPLVPVLSLRQLGGHPHLRDAIVALVEGES